MEFLTDAQVAGYGRFVGVPSRSDLGDRRGDHNRLGLMVQATTVRYIGGVPEGPGGCAVAGCALTATQFAHEGVSDHADVALPAAHGRRIRPARSGSWSNPRHRPNGAGRSTSRDVLNQIHDLREAGIGLRTLADAIPIDTSKPGDAMNDLAIVLLSLFAQMERTYAAERAAHARAVREEKGQRTGRKIASNTERHLEWARHLRDVDHLTMAEITAKTGIPRTSLYRHFNRMDDRAVSAG